LLCNGNSSFIIIITTWLYITVTLIFVLFAFVATAAKFVLPIPVFFLAYLDPLDVDVTGNITAKLCEVRSEFNIFCTLVTMATAAILNLFNPPKAATHYG
jgi:hypothetical protein